MHSQNNSAISTNNTHKTLLNFAHFSLPSLSKNFCPWLPSRRRVAEKEGRAQSCSSNSSSETAAGEVLSGSKRESQCAKGGDTGRQEIGEKFTLSAPSSPLCWIRRPPCTGPGPRTDTLCCGASSGGDCSTPSVRCRRRVVFIIIKISNKND